MLFTSAKSPGNISVISRDFAIYISLFIGLFWTIISLNVFAQTANPANPIGSNQSTIPQFSAIASSLVTSGVTYNVAVSESPRGGVNSQYQDFWVKAGISANDLMPSNASRLTWSSGWTRNIRSAGYDGAVTSSTVGSPASLTPGKTYYWHIVGTNGTKSAQASFTVMSLPAQPTLTINNNLNRNLFEISWGSVSNVARYELYRNNVLIYSGMNTSQEVSAVSAGVSYTFMIKACNAAGCTSGASGNGNYPVPPTTAVIQAPLVGGTASAIPLFEATTASLVSTASYTLAISESPRAGLNNQYADFWSINGLGSSALTAGNPSQASWGSNWVRRTRYGNPDGPATIVNEPTSPTLTVGKTYYWHIVASGSNGGLSKSAEGRFVVVASSSSSSVASSSGAFDFNTQAPTAFNYSLGSSGLPSLGSNQLVATTQGNLTVNNGAANYAITIDLPPAVRDLKPKLSLNYNSRSGNGLMGVGWSLSGLSAIARCRANFATEGAQAQKSNPRYSIGDRLCLDGQKLVVASSSVPANDSTYWSTGTEYKTELDNFAKIVAYGSSANGGHGYFKVWTKDGRVLTYGEQASAQNSKVYAPNQQGGPVNTWALDKVEDAYGNNYIINYEQNNATGEFYPAQINLGSTGLVVFTYQTRNGQTPWGYDAGNKYQLTKVLDKVTTFVGANTATPIKQYDVNYKISTTTNRELVETIQECGYEAGAWKCAKPVTFDWQKGQQGFLTNPSLYNCNGSIVGAIFNVHDIDDDGFSDLLHAKGVAAWGTASGCFVNSNFPVDPLTHSFQILRTRYGNYGVIVQQRINTESNPKFDAFIVRLDRAASTITKTLVAQLDSTKSIFIGDFNNDGLDDFIADSRFWLQNPSVVPSFGESAIPSVAWDAPPESSLLDLNSDGLRDLVFMKIRDPNNAYTKNLFQGYLNLKTHFNRGMLDMANEASPTFPISGLPFSNSMVMPLGRMYYTLLDVNGDGLQDLLYQSTANEFIHSPGNWYIKPAVGSIGANGHSFSDAPVVDSGIPVAAIFNATATVPVFHGGPQSDYQFSAQYAFTYDYDQDGDDDMIVLRPKAGGGFEWRVHYMNYVNGLLKVVDSGIDPFLGVANHFAQKSVFHPMETLFKADVNNDGLLDMVLSGQVFLSKQQQPDLINKITDGFGVVTELAYSPLTGDANNGKPLYTPDTVAPVFPQQPVNRAMQVVKKLSTSNGKSGFHHAYFNYAGGLQDVFRGFSGFKSISFTNTSTNVNSITEYRQDWPYVGRIKKQTVKDTGGKLISIVDNNYALHPQNARFPYLDYSLQKNYELSTTSDSSPLSVNKTINTFDTCGNLTEQTTRIGSGFSGVEVTGELSSQLIVNDYDENNTAECHDDFLATVTQDVSKIANATSKRVITEFKPNSQRDVYSRTDFKNETIQKTTTYDRETNGVVNKITEVAKDIDGTDEPARITTFSNFVYGMYPQTVTNAENHATTLAYDYRFGAVKTETFLGQTTTNTYDPLGRLLSRKTPDGALTETIAFYCSNSPVTCQTGTNPAYYGLATQVTHTSQSGKLGEPLSIVFYDSLQREVRSAVYALDGKAINQVTQYSDAGNLYRVSEPYVTNGIVADISLANAWTVYSSYDALGRATTITGADGGTKTTRYTTDGYGFKITDDILVVKPVGGSETQTSSRWVNALGQVVRVEDALLNTVSYSYDAAGNLENTQVNNNLATTIELLHDSAGNKTYIKDPDAGVINFEFNGFGELRKQTWQKNIAGVEKNITYDYDKLGRQTSRIDKPASGSTVSYSWVWDTKQQGQLSTRSGNGFHEEYFYDGFSRVSRQIVTTSGLSGGEFVYTYDNFSRPETVKYPNGFKIQRDYHAAGYQVQTRDVTATARVLWALGNTVDTRGAFNNQLWGNGVVTQTGLDNKSGRLTSIKSGRLSSTNTFASLSGDIQNLAYSYDSLGNLITRNTARTTASGSALENVTETFGYDKLNRVKTISTSGLFSRTQTFEYDTGGLGNLINRSDLLSGSSVNNDVGQLKYEQLRNAGVHAVTSAGGINYSYDKYGNMTARGSESIIYDTFNKPTRIAGASITDFYYGPDHELYKETSGTKTTYKLAGGMYEVIVDGTTTTQKSYVDGVILNNRTLTNGTQSANDTLYLHTDHLGSTEATTNALGQFVNRMSFGAWGERQKSDWKPGTPTETFLTTNGFTGHDQLDNHNLVHMGGRVYDPNLGRFLSADIVVQSPYDSQSFNRYSYTSNNPLSYTDPSGYKRSSSGCTAAADVCGNFTEYMRARQADAARQASLFTMFAYTNSDNLTGLDGGTFYDPNFFGQNALFKEGIAQANADLSDAMNNAEPDGNSALNKNLADTMARLQGRLDWANDPAGAGAWAASYTNDQHTKTLVTIISSVVPVGRVVGAGAALGGKLVTVEGALFKSFNIKAPFNIPVQRFGQITINGGQHWGPRIGTNPIINRLFAAIKKEWNPLTHYTTGIIPKGTPINFGIVGPQGFRYPGGSVQFITESRNVIEQTTKVIPR